MRRRLAGIGLLVAAVVLLVIIGDPGDATGDRLRWYTLAGDTAACTGLLLWSSAQRQRLIPRERSAAGAAASEPGRPG